MKVLNRDLQNIARLLLLVVTASVLICTSDTLAQKKGSIEDFIELHSKIKDEKQKEVEQNVTQWGTGGERWENFQGADEAESKTASAEDGGAALSVFNTCQDMPHMFMLLMTPPYLTRTQDACGIRYIYPGPSIGTCIRCIPSGPPCFSFCWTASMIEYYYPAFKIDVSDQVLATPYIEKRSAKSILDSLQQIDKKLPEEITNVITLASNKSKQGIEDKNPSLARKMKQPDNGKVKSLVQKEFAKIEQFRKLRPDLQFMNQDSKKAYSRNFTEMLNDITDDFTKQGDNGLFVGIPHVPVTHYFGTDLPMGFAFSRFLSKSALFTPQFFAFMTKKGERRCIQNNIAMGKTKPLRGFVSRGMIDTTGSCIDGVGELFPFTDQRRTHITDAAYQAAIKGMKIFYALPFNKHSYRESSDKWSVIRPTAFRNESNGCATIDKMPRMNTTYLRANAKEAKTSGRTTFTVWPVFKGCWNYKGKSERNWLPTELAEIPGLSKLPYGKFRVK